MSCDSQMLCGDPWPRWRLLGKSSRSLEFIGRRLSQGTLIRLPYCPVQYGRKRDPGQVRDQQQTCERFEARKLNSGAGDESPKQDDVREGQASPVPGEEHPAPECVCRELSEEQAECQLPDS